MTASYIESAPTQSIQSLRSKFEQLALGGGCPSTSVHPNLTPVSVVPQGPTVVAPKSVSTIRSRTLSSLLDDSMAQSQPTGPVYNLRNEPSASDPTATALKRGLPPQPPNRTKKPAFSRISSALLRPVPVQVVRQSSDAEPLLPDHRASGVVECSGDGSSVGVASCHDISLSTTQIRKPTSSAVLHGPRLPPRPPTITSHSNSVMVEAAPVIPFHNTSPGAPGVQVRSRSLASSIKSFLPGILATDVSSRAPKPDYSGSSGIPGFRPSNDCLSPNVALLAPRSLDSPLSAGEDSSNLSSSSDSSLFTHFSDTESEVSEVSLSPAVKSGGKGGSGEFDFVDGTHTLEVTFLDHGEYKPFGNTKLPPPPTRTIGPGDKLPPVRRVYSPPSDEETGSEEYPHFHNAEFFPDSSRSSKRPPTLLSASLVEHNIHVPAHSGHVVSSGSGVVVASGHHIKYYDFLSRAGPSWTLDTRDGMEGSVISCLEFKSTHDLEDQGHFLWVGTKEGHLFEVDIGIGIFTSCKMGIHASQVTHIFRQGSIMITIEETGKALFFDPNSNGEDSLDNVHLLCTAPQVCHLGEKVDFAKLLGGLLWTSVRTDLNGIGTASVPVVRIHDIFAPRSAGHPIMPTQHVGAVTSGTIIPLQHDLVYLGHEGGFISVWKTATDDGIPACIEVVKASTSDVLCLEGVNDRLWAGGRKGTISVYDVQAKPWVVTNCWDAHGGLPVSRIFVDPYAVALREKLCVVSIGRDEKLRFWDGLLSVEHIEQELLRREHAFSTFRDLKVLVVSWNVDAAKPESLVGDPENVHFLHNVLTSVDSPDIISFGLQEVIDLESSTMAAKTILLGGKRKGEEGHISEKVTSSYRKWRDQLMQAVKLAMPPESPYTVAHTESLVGLFTCMFVKDTQRASLRNPAIATLKRGMGGHYGNKGGIIARFLLDDSSLCFINCHLAAGQHHVRQRNADVAAFLEETEVFPPESTEELGYVDGGDGSMILDHEIVFLNGDMNYRIDKSRDTVISSIEANDLDRLVEHDQLHKEMKHNRAFRLRAFQEGPLTFTPTYKYDRQSDVFDTSEKQRVPAWCDRVLWRSREQERVRLLDYRRWEPKVSDHRPVSASFQVTVKRVLWEEREKEKLAVETWWEGRERLLLAEAKKYYDV